MSRILKASYVNLKDDNIVIDNNFEIEGIEVIEEVPTEQEIPEQDTSQIKDEILEIAREQAKQIVQNAKDEAVNITKLANDEIQKKSEEIYSENFDKSYKDAIDKATNDTNDIKVQAEQLLIKTEQECNETIQAIEEKIVKFIVDTTQNILTSSFEFDPQLISLLIKKGLQNVKEIKNLKIYVSELNYEYVEQNKNEILNTNTMNIEIIKDVSLENTDCTIETEMGIIKCGIGEQLSGIKEALYYILD